MKFLTNIFATISKVAVKVTLAVVVMFAETFFIRAQEPAERIYYRFDNAVVDAEYLSNSQAFANIDSLLRNGSFEAFEIVSYSSPEGNFDYNFNLSTRRANALMKYLAGRYPQLAGKLSVKPAAEAWEALRSAVESDVRLSDSAKSLMLQIIDSNDPADTKERKLGALQSYRYLYNNYFRTLRYAEVRFTDNSIKGSSDKVSSYDKASSEKAVRFALNSVVVDRDFSNNAEVLDSIEAILDGCNADEIESIVIVASAAPDSTAAVNDLCAQQRGQAVYDYIVAKHPELAGKITVRSTGAAWQDLRNAVEADTTMTAESRAEVLSIIDSSASDEEKEAELRSLSVWNHLSEDIFPEMRSARVAINTNAAADKAGKASETAASKDAVRFALNSVVVDRDFSSNAEVLDSIEAILDGCSADEIESIVIVASAAPDSTDAVNDLCAQQRGQAVYDYIVAKHPELAGKITVRSTGVAWQDLRKAVEADSTITAENRDKVLSIIDSSASDEEKEAELRALPVWDHLSEDIFPEMRSARVTINTTAAGEKAEKAEKVEKAEKASETAASKDAVRFALNSVVVDRDFSNNAEVLDDLAALIESRSADEIESIDVFAKTSPDGPVYVNNRCAKQRGQAVKDYIESKYPELSGKITVHSAGEAWEDLRVAVESDTALSESSRSKILSIIVSPVADDEKEAKLRELPEWEHLFEDVFPGLRCASAEVKFKETAPAEPDAPVAEPAEITVEDEMLVVDETLKVEDTTRLNLPLMPYKKTVIAVKTNLLYDLATALNFEVEIPIGKRWSLVAEDVFPWWETGNKYCFQMWEMGLEARCWLKPWKVDSIHKMNGWFAGLYGMSAKFDFQYDKSINYQGEYWSVGATIGYSQALGRRKWANLEFSLSTGFLEAPYRHYYPTDDYSKLIKDPANNGTFYNFFLYPTKAKISLVIPINAKYMKEVRHE